MYLKRSRILTTTEAFFRTSRDINCVSTEIYLAIGFFSRRKIFHIQMYVKQSGILSLITKIYWKKKTKHFCFVCFKEIINKIKIALEIICEKSSALIDESKQQFTSGSWNTSKNNRKCYCLYDNPQRIWENYIVCHRLTAIVQIFVEWLTTQ